MARRLFWAVGLLLLLAGCLAPKPEAIVQAWRPMGPQGPTLAQALAKSPWRKSVVWEAYSAGGAPDVRLVRVTVEYQPAGADASCPAPTPGKRRAARLFLILECAISPQATVTFTGARAQVYTAKGFFEEYPLSLGVMADLMAGAFPLPCDVLALPSYL